MGYSYLKKAMLGYKTVETKEEAEQMMFSIGEGEQILNDLQDYENQVKTLTNKTTSLTKDLMTANTKINDLNNDLLKLKKSYEEKISILEKNNSILKINLSSEKKKNANLMRITRERANVERGIRPKKSLGYLELKKEKLEILKKIKEETKGIHSRIITKNITYQFWKYHVQTPYPKSLDYNTVFETVKNDFIKNMGIYIYNNFKACDSNEKIENVRNSKSVVEFSLGTSLNSNYWELKFLSGMILNF